MGNTESMRSSRPPHTAAASLAASVDDPFYYLHNFETVLAWVLDRYRDLLAPDEIRVLERFPFLARNARALFVRMVMRKGSLFRASRLRYDEIGPTRAAATTLLAQGWIELDPPLHAAELFSILTKDEIAAVFGAHLARRSGRKADWLAEIENAFPQARLFSAWCPVLADQTYALTLAPLCDRIRLLFFGNLHQDWSEFVLSDLGVFRYEAVELPAAARAFQVRVDIDDYMRIHHCRERLERGESLPAIIGQLVAIDCRNAWLVSRRNKLLFRIGEQCERNSEWELALHVYQQCLYPGARVRRIRTLERLQRFEEAMALCDAARLVPENEAELQRVQRIVPRLQRRLGHAATRTRIDRSSLRIDLELPRPAEPFYVEQVVQALLAQADGPVHYVENTLINSLFGLLCWEAIFAAVPGAFFHPFQSGPADLLGPDFRAARAPLFARLFAQLDTGEYQATIRRNYRAKFGLQSPFVYWAALSDELLEQALSCLPAAHLQRLFERLLDDIRANRAGLPDLIQFWPAERRYQMIEVKGPGDRLQDNQVRWIDYCVQHGMPVSVCYVQWQDTLA